jgi:hypothetical protein
MILTINEQQFVLKPGPLLLKELFIEDNQGNNL